MLRIIRNYIVVFRHQSTSKNNILTKGFSSKAQKDQTTKLPPRLAKNAHWREKYKKFFLNKYFSIFYFILGWHFVGYFLIKGLQGKAKEQNLEPVIKDNFVRYSLSEEDRKERANKPWFEIQIVKKDEKK